MQDIAQLYEGFKVLQNNNPALSRVIPLYCYAAQGTKRIVRQKRTRKLDDTASSTELKHQIRYLARSLQIIRLAADNGCDHQTRLPPGQPRLHRPSPRPAERAPQSLPARQVSRGRPHTKKTLVVHDICGHRDGESRSCLECRLAQGESAI